jgi:hypothetical protein
VNFRITGEENIPKVDISMQEGFGLSSGIRLPELVRGSQGFFVNLPALS